jgi:hypothetical protein
MEIPASLKIFNIIYECRLWLIIPLAVVWSVFLSMQLYHRKRKAFFITLAALPLAILPLAVTTTWSGWHYRMELRDRFAQIPNQNGAIDINLMPPSIHAEYARHDFHPRLRDVKAIILWNLLLMPLTALGGGAVWFMVKKAPAKESSNQPEAVGNII